MRFVLRSLRNGGHISSSSLVAHSWKAVNERACEARRMEKSVGKGGGVWMYVLEK
jgi:hypothetical protein